MRFRSYLFNLIRFLPAFIKAPILRSAYQPNETPPDMIFKIAESTDEYSQAFQIVHDSLVDSGYMRPEFTGFGVTKYHIHPATTVLIAKLKGEVIATLSIIGDSSVGLPLDRNWDLSPLRFRNKRIGELTALAVKQNYRSQMSRILFPLFKFMKDYSLHYAGLETVVVSTHPTVKDFYKHVLLFLPVERHQVKRQKNGARDKANAFCMDLDTEETRERLKRVYEGRKNNFYDYFFHGVSKSFRFPGPRGAKCVWSIMGLEEIRFFIQCQDGLKEEITAEEREKIALAYPDSKYTKIIMGDENYQPKVETRFQAKGEIQVFLSDKSFNGSLRGASLSGLQALFEKPVNVGETVNCLIKWPINSEFMIRAKVIWSKNGVYGLHVVSPKQGNWNHFVLELGSSFRTIHYSTVTDFAKFLGWSTSCPKAFAK